MCLASSAYTAASQNSLSDTRERSKPHASGPDQTRLAPQPGSIQHNYKDAGCPINNGAWLVSTPWSSPELAIFRKLLCRQSDPQRASDRVLWLRPRRTRWERGISKATHRSQFLQNDNLKRFFHTHLGQPPALSVLGG